MTIFLQHEWDLSPPAAIALQRELATRVIGNDTSDQPPQRVAGIDVGYEANGTVTRAAVAVLSYPGLQPLESVLIRRETRFPYIPGLLSFREIPAVLDALARLDTLPDLILCDGQGLAHPRRFGLACHLGVLTDLPTIGVAKTRLIGTYVEPPQIRGAWTPLLDKDETIGAVLRTRVGCHPLFISIGHRVSLETAVAQVLACTTRYRLPETTRQAHSLASATPRLSAL